MMYTREDKVAHLRNSNADWVPKLKIPKPSLPQTEDTPPISQKPAPTPVSGAHGLKGGFMGILMGVVGFLLFSGDGFTLREREREMCALC